MKQTLFVCALASFICLPAISTLAAEADSGGQMAAKSLFDGATLSGWRGYKTEAPGDGWKVVDGMLMLKGKAGDLVTVEEFGDFDLELEWKVADATNSGVIYRVGLGDNATYVTGPEYQVLDNLKAEDNKKATHLAASLYDLAGPEKDFTRPVGEWNSARIRVRGWHVEHWLNGEKVVDVDLESPAGKALIAASKFKDWPKFASLKRGHIALQDHGHLVSFRNIRIRKLN
jgi:hypothetical protein